MNFIEKLADKWGPEKIIQVYDPRTKMKGILVIDNTALGPAKGGIRMTPTVDVEEVFRLARAMTWKCSLAGLPFGGGKSGIIANPKVMVKKEKYAQVAAFARALKPVSPSMYVAAPDISTAEDEMRVFANANGSLQSCTGKPADMGGIPHELGSTGFGIAHSTVVALKHLNMSVKGVTVAIEGFGNVGSFAAKFLSEWGAKVIAVSDSKGVIYNKNGLDFDKISEAKERSGSVVNYRPGEKLANDKIFELEVDVIIPAALPDVIDKGNSGRVKARLIVEGSNIPMTREIEVNLHERGVLVVPDFVANSGGVISSYVEYIGKDADYMFKLVEEKIKKNTKAVIEHAKSKGLIPRDAALEIAQKGIREAMNKKKTTFINNR